MSKPVAAKLIAEKEVRQSRLAECKGCPNFKKNICTACGCYVPFKISILKPTCPKGKWKQ